MAKSILTIFLFSVFLCFSNLSIANPNIDQWLESEKSYKDLINEGFEVKSYATVSYTHLTLPTKRIV